MCGGVCGGVCVRAQTLVQLRVTLCTVALQTPLSMGFSRQDYWSGLPCLSSGDLPDPGIEPTSPVAPELQVDCKPQSYQEAHSFMFTHVQ